MKTVPLRPEHRTGKPPFAGPAYLIGALVACCLAVTLVGCGNPCGNIWKKLEKCAKAEGRKHHRTAESRKEFFSMCKKADKSHVKKCIILKDCEKISRCAARIQKK